MKSSLYANLSQIWFLVKYAHIHLCSQRDPGFFEIHNCFCIQSVVIKTILTDIWRKSSFKHSYQWAKRCVHWQHFSDNWGRLVDRPTDRRIACGSDMLVLECVLVCGWCLTLILGISFPHLIFEMGFSLKLDLSGWLDWWLVTYRDPPVPVFPVLG